MTKSKERCVVTGLGAVTAIGNDALASFKNAIIGVCGIDLAKSVDTADCYARLAAEVNDDALDKIVDADELDRAAKLCITASGEALRDAGMSDLGGSARAAVVMGSCVGGVASAEHYYKNGKLVSDIAKIPISAIASETARAYKAGGIVMNIANACAAGTISVAYACDLIRSGKADVVIAGGADAFSSIPFAGFLSLHALDPKPCSPFNRSSGITLGEGAGALVIESYEHAVQRHARIYCDVLGSGVSGDAYHITAPRPDGEGQMSAIRRAMESSGIMPKDIGYINAHGTGTAKNDEAEFLSLHTIFDGKDCDLSVSSTKAMVGHCLGAAGAIEAVLSIKALTEGIIPPTIDYSESELETLTEKAGELDFCPNVAKRKSLSTVMSNSFAFGGNNASVVFSKNPGNIKPQTRERVFITGIGIVSPVGNGVENYINCVKSHYRAGGDGGSDRVGYSTVCRDDYDACGLKSSFYRKLDNFSRMQAVSGMYALSDAKLSVTEENAENIGIVVGTSDGPMNTICNYQEDLIRKGNSAGSAFKFPNTVYNAAGGYLSICSGIRGYNVTLTNGIQSGLASIEYAANIIRSGKETAVLASGNDENSETIAELYDALGCFSDNEFKLADGSTTLVAESESGMKDRGAKPYAEILGFGTASKPVKFGTISGSGEALEKAVMLAVEDAGLSCAEIDGVIGFADGLAEVDEIQDEALKNIFHGENQELPIFNINKIVGECRAASAALSAAHGALILSGAFGETVLSENVGLVKASTLKNLLVISYASGGTYTAIILSNQYSKEVSVV